MPRSALLSLLLLAGPVAADPLAVVLKHNAPAALRKLKDKGFANVGVLPFAGGKGDLGELGRTLAARTAQALTLANTDDAFTVLQDPHQQARSVKGVSPLTADGRKGYFALDYRPGFGQDRVPAAALLAGSAELSADLKTLTFKLRVCGPSGELEDLSDALTADADATLLGEAGRSYAVPKAKRAALVTGAAAEAVRESAAETVKVVATAPARTPRSNPALDACPIKWGIHYDGKPQTADGDRVPEPDEKVEAEFVLSNPSKDETFAVVLLVNGENTLGRERVAVEKCRKWVLPPESEVVVKGFQADGQAADKFLVVPADDQRVKESAELGLFRLVVFAGKVEDGPEPKPAPKPARQIPHEELIASARLPDAPSDDFPQTRKGLLAQLTLKTGGLRNTRGVIVGGEKVESKTTVVRFVPEGESPVADITLRYHGGK